ncbi:hypothetical protein A3B45_00825 [Candidatus Daviesbacteria bacterium RIFCSPLOWO2_01_FULL_39_12]|uniref:Uncharacterized protein n=1 Tax=Candidatus Daviesbacteria bacterium RIFCSPLOWO2_01_FULL_39_12 TaxID=1797785 RepID=A0A1F5KRI5_9BACT|nr:MAG: hypothetical protein A3D79_03745 [Candidatus Daviesbacteria bacterium RIFCSPHIGHO2_02_FULL_39_8]OGE43251.1 MAG: hypothetical protein A3B45_00825 [Candidatus Daviesbacteria bacterium RIFCSPLOWO2_01_FULL_39_12]
MESVDAAISPESSSQPFHSSGYIGILKEFGEKVPEKTAVLQIAFDEFDRQAIKNFESYGSSIYPGVAFSFTKVSITPELIRKMSAHVSEMKLSVEQLETPVDDEFEKEEGHEEKTTVSRQDFFLFTAFGIPPGSNAFTVEDVALDRFIRLLPRVARAIKQGETPPEINIYLLGSPYGFAGRVTPEWIKLLKANGFEEYGRLYAEFIQQQEQIQPEQQLKNTHIVLQGKSKGAIIADKTSHYLSEDLQRVTQRLLDSPAGHHNPESIMRWFKGAQVAVGLAVETLFSKYFDDLMKSMNRQDQAFLENLSKTSNIPMDDKEQMRLKLEAALADGLLLLRGSPLDTENNRSFIRQGIYDPLTFSPKRIFDIWQRHRKNKGGFVSFSEGRSLQAPYRSAHFSIHKRFERWKTILDYCQGATKNK